MDLSQQTTAIVNAIKNLPPEISDKIIKEEIAEFVNEIENHKALVAILKFVKIIYRDMRRGVFDEE